MYFVCLRYDVVTLNWGTEETDCEPGKHVNVRTSDDARMMMISEYDDTRIKL
jgi:hypothetical protein